MYGDYSYLHLGEDLDFSQHLVAIFRVKASVDLKIAAEAIAAESSVGTWTHLSTMTPAKFNFLSAKVIAIDKKSGLIKIAYPVDLWEPDNLAQLLSGIAGNVFGLKELDSLWIEDIIFPEKYVRYYEGPAFGVNGIRDYLKIYDRPILGTIIKPKLGLTAKEHAQAAYEAWLNGVDLVKDDENLTSQPFNNFYDRVSYVLELKKQAEAKTGEKKIYAANITAQPDEMLRRAQQVMEHGGGCVMLDILTTGLSMLEYLRKQDYNLIIHGHRAMHAALTRGHDFGMNMSIIAKLARLAGVDELHIGTVVGKMEGSRQEVMQANKELMKPWYGLKRVMHVASGGLHPGLVEKMVSIIGKNVIINMGGGIHGHPGGTAAGAKAARQAIDLVSRGQSLKEVLKTGKYPQLNKAIDKWGMA